jgi:hypothetical protein
MATSKPNPFAGKEPKRGAPAAKKSPYVPGKGADGKASRVKTGACKK